ncbi:unnamed protein product [Owenia fusiformis]|uniref:Uncharacterized protein n=1 Tax=Owenia fusiformis TaxID=6347 RepID=A0A8J1TZF7_OWEFU|nr:unnamed protein product [Owenia fusiformis]
MSGSGSVPKSDADIALDIANKLVKKGIKVVALDFDQTIVSVHTSGCWKQGSVKLTSHVRPCFRHLIPKLMEAGLRVAVVTYSMQSGLISDVLNSALKDCDTNRIVIKTSSKDWEGESCAETLGKQQHIASVLTDLYNEDHTNIIQSNEILLLDDDMDNVTVAVNFGHKAFAITDNVSLESLCRYVNNAL